MSTRFQRASAFTLVEVIVAIGIVTVALLSLLALAGASVSEATSIQRRDAALRLRATIESAFHGSGDYDRFYEALRSGKALYAYCYGTDEDAATQTDGTPIASANSPLVLAYEQFNVLRLADDPALPAEAGDPTAIAFRLDLELFDPETGALVDPATLPEDSTELASATLVAKVTLVAIPGGPPLPDADSDPVVGEPLTSIHVVLRP